MRKIDQEGFAYVLIALILAIALFAPVVVDRNSAITEAKDIAPKPYFFVGEGIMFCSLPSGEIVTAERWPTTDGEEWCVEVTGRYGKESFTVLSRSDADRFIGSYAKARGGKC